MRLFRNSFVAIALAILTRLGAWCAQPILIPNGSFEQPAISFAGIRIVSWQETPKPDDYVEGGGYTWDQLTGVFYNTPPGASDHIDNCDLTQAGYFFNVPGVGLFQDYESVDWNDPEPSHALDARFEVGNAYVLTFGVVPGGGNLPVGATFEAALYYRNATNAQVPVAVTLVTNSCDVFPCVDEKFVRTHLTYFQVKVPEVQPTDAWAGQHVGIRFQTSVKQGGEGGYWDLDDVRLVAVSLPMFSVNATLEGESLKLSWRSVAGYSYQLQVSQDLVSWSDYGEPRVGTDGELSTPVPLAGPGAAYFNVLVTALP